MTKKTFKLIIDDLEEIEAKEIMQFIINSVENDDLPFAIQDCMTIYDPQGNIVE